MKKDAKIGLSIILGAVLLSALIIGKALQSRGPKPVTIPGEAGAPVSPGGSEGQLSVDDGSGAVDTASGSLDELTGGSPDAGNDGSTDYADGSLADAGTADAGTGTGSTGSDTFGLSGTVPAEEGGSDAGSGTGSSGSSEAAPAGASTGTSRGDGTAEEGAIAGSAMDSGAANGAGGDASGVAGTESTAGPSASSSSSVETGSSTPPAGSDFSYTVQENDSAWKIAKRFLGKGIHWKKIAKANPAVDFSNLKVGIKLTIPGRIGSSGRATTSTSAVDNASVPLAAGTRVHKVASGDSLYIIAKKYLGSGMRYREIIKLNPGVDPSRLRIGQKLQIPAR